jgi:hypothetical protein
MRRSGDPLEDIRLGVCGDIVSHVVVEETASIAVIATSSLHSACKTDSYAVGVIGIRGIFPDSKARESERVTCGGDFIIDEGTPGSWRILASAGAVPIPMCVGGLVCITGVSSAVVSTVVGGILSVGAMPGALVICTFVGAFLGGLAKDMHESLSVSVSAPVARRCGLYLLFCLQNRLLGRCQ